MRANNILMGLVIAMAVCLVPAFAAATFTVNVTAPANNSYTNSTTPVFTFNVSGGNDSYNCSLYVGTVKFGDNGSALNASASTILANASIPYGNNSYYVNCTNDSTSNTSATQYIVMDNRIPNLTASAPTALSYVRGRPVTITYTLTDDYLNTTNISIVNASGTVINSTANTSNGTVSVTMNIYADGIYNITISPLDKAGNSNSTMIQNVTFDGTNPLLVIANPATNTTVETTLVVINLTVTEANINTTNVTIYNSTGGLVNSTANTSTGSVKAYLSVYGIGAYSVNATTYDLAGNTNTTGNTGVVIRGVYNNVTVTNTVMVYPSSADSTQFGTIQTSMITTMGTVFSVLGLVLIVIALAMAIGSLKGTMTQSPVA